MEMQVRETILVRTAQVEHYARIQGEVVKPLDNLARINRIRGMWSYGAVLLDFSVLKLR